MPYWNSALPTCHKAALHRDYPASLKKMCEIVMSTEITEESVCAGGRRGAFVWVCARMCNVCRVSHASV